MSFRKCPACGERATCESVDVGVGIIYGLYGCQCGWSEDEKYDIRSGPKYENGYRLDQWGGLHKQNSLQDLKNTITKNIFKITKEEAIKKNICIDCKQPITDKSFYSLAGQKEYKISGMCEHCFDKACGF